METNTAETETFNGKHTKNETESVDDEMTQNIKFNSRAKNGKTKIVFCFCLLVIAAALIVVFGVYHNFSENTQPQPNHLTTQEFVEEITEDLLVCQQDINCHEFNMTSDELSKIRNAFNRYDGNNDDKWSKQEFIKYYIEVSQQNELFNIMDVNNDRILSYKEMVLYLLNIKGQTFIKDTLVPIYDQLIQSIYRTNVTSNDQLYWEYIGEMFFYSFDDTQEGYILKDNYLHKLGEIEFGLIASNETNDECITFDEFIEFEFNSNNIKKSVDNDYLGKFGEIDFTKNTMKNLHLKHQLYQSSGFVDDNIRRLRTFTSAEWNCIFAVSGCTGAAVSTLAACAVSGFTFGWSLVACIGGSLGTFGACGAAYQICYPLLPGQ